MQEPNSPGRRMGACKGPEVGMGRVCSRPSSWAFHTCLECGHKRGVRQEQDKPGRKPSRRKVRGLEFNLDSLKAPINSSGPGSFLGQTWDTAVGVSVPISWVSKVFLLISQSPTLEPRPRGTQVYSRTVSPAGGNTAGCPRERSWLGLGFRDKMRAGSKGWGHSSSLIN